MGRVRGWIYVDGDTRIGFKKRVEKGKEKEREVIHRQKYKKKKMKMKKKKKKKREMSHL